MPAAGRVPPCPARPGAAQIWSAAAASLLPSACPSSCPAPPRAPPSLVGLPRRPHRRPPPPAPAALPGDRPLNRQPSPSSLTSSPSPRIVIAAGVFGAAASLPATTSRAPPRQAGRSARATAPRCDARKLRGRRRREAAGGEQEVAGGERLRATQAHAARMQHTLYLAYHGAYWIFQHGIEHAAAALFLSRGDEAQFAVLKEVEEVTRGVAMVHVADLCRAELFLAEEEAAAAGRYICCGLNTTILELARFLADKYPQYPVKTELL